MASSLDATASSTQLQSNAHSTVPAPSSSILSAKSSEPQTTLGGSLEAMHDAVVATTHVEGSAPPSEASGASSEPVIKRKGVGKRLTDRQRVEILELMEKSGGSVSNAEIARRYGITRAAIQKLKKKGPEVRARYRYGSAETRDGRKRGGCILSVPFERELFEWVRGLKARKVPVPPSLVKEKAKLLVPKYGLGDFRASNGWYYNFCKRFSLPTGVLVEEKPPIAAQAAAMDNADTSLDTDQAQLQQLAINALEQQTYEQIHQYHQQQIAAIAAATLQQQQEHVQQAQKQHQRIQHQIDSSQGCQSKSDQMLALLDQQNILLERQNNMIEEQTKTVKKLFEVVAKGGTAL